jgi:hypothetical protein
LSSERANQASDRNAAARWPALALARSFGATIRCQVT